MIARWLVGALLLVGLAEVGNAGELRSYPPIAGWTVGAFSADRGAFSHCAGYARQPNGVYMMFSVSRSYRWSIAFHHPSWMTLTRGAQYDVAFVIDEGQPLTARAIAVGSGLVEISLVESTALFNEFRRGRLLRLAVGGRVNAYTLGGTSAVLPALLACVRNELNPRAATELFAAAPPVAPTPKRTELAAQGRAVADRQDRSVSDRPNRSTSDRVARVSPDRDPPEGRDNALQAEATVLLANVLSQSGISGFSLAPADKSAKLNVDASWIAGDVVGWLRVVPGTPVNDPDLRGFVIGLEANDCKGAFLSGTLPEDDKQRIRIFTSCQEDGKASTSYFSVVARPKGGIYVFNTMAIEAKDAFSSQQMVKEADDGLRQAVYRVVK